MEETKEAFGITQHVWRDRRVRKAICSTAFIT